MNWNQHYNYHFPTEIFFGHGIIKKLGEHLKQRNLKKPLLVTDEKLSQLPLFKKIYESLKSSGLDPEGYHQIHKNPIKNDVLSGVESYHQKNCDSIIGLGGGASMDVARGIALKCFHERDLFDFDDSLGGDQYVTEKIPYFITVPTTSGTGSEVGRSTIIADDITKEKKILFSPRLMAKAVFADPELTLDLPFHVTAATGMDAFTHHIEAYLAKGFNPLCDGLALEGMKLIRESLEKATHKPCLETHSKMMMAALMGATAFQKGLGLVHSTAHSLSTLFDLHHGLANAIMLKYGLEFNAKTSGDKLQFLSKFLNLENQTTQGFIEYIEFLTHSLGLPQTLSSQGVKETDIEKLSGLAIKDVCHQSNPRPVTEYDFRNIYKQAIKGGH
jgi:alcohol dehydrogenase class IV